MTTTDLRERFISADSELTIGEAQVVDTTAEVTFQSYYDKSARQFDALFTAEPKVDDVTLEGVVGYQDFLTALLHSIENNGDHPLPSFTPDINQAHYVTEGLISEFLSNIPWCLPPKKFRDGDGHSLTTYNFKLTPYEKPFVRLIRVECDGLEAKTVHYSIAFPGKADY